MRQRRRPTRSVSLWTCQEPHSQPMTEKKSNEGQLRDRLDGKGQRATVIYDQEGPTSLTRDRGCRSRAAAARQQLGVVPAVLDSMGDDSDRARLSTAGRLLELTDDRE